MLDVDLHHSIATLKNICHELNSCLPSHKFPSKEIRFLSRLLKKINQLSKAYSQAQKHRTYISKNLDKIFLLKQEIKYALETKKLVLPSNCLSELNNFIKNSQDAFLSVFNTQNFDKSLNRIVSMAHHLTLSESEETDLKGHILVFDSNPNTSFTLKKRLESEGHRLILCPTLDEFWENLTYYFKSLNLILIDQSHKDFDLQDILEKIHKDKMVSFIPIIILGWEKKFSSVHDWPISSYVVDYLTKPINPLFLKTRVQSALEKKYIYDLRKKRLKELEKLRNQLQEAISKIPDGFALLNHNNEIVLHNDHFIQIYTHYKQLLPYLGNLKGLSLKDFLSLNHEHNPHLIGNFDSKDKATEAKLEMCQSHQSEWHEVNEKGKLIKVNYYKTANDCSILVVRDIAQSVAIEEELTYMAYHDSLTGLSNRKYFIHQLQQTMMSLVPPFKIAVFFIDLDGFKNINDTFGHEMGDWILIQVAQRLRRCIREGDSIARLGGDEFGVLLNKVEDIPTITHVAQRMLKTIITPYNRQHQTFSIGASIGIAIYPQDGSDVETILNAADNAMYEAKISGKEQFRFASTPVLKEVYFSGL